VRRRTLGVPGEREFRGQGIIESGARDRADVRGKRVLIVGGGDAAFENALILSEFAESVTVAFRKPDPTARPEFHSAVRNADNIRVAASTVVEAINGNSAVEAVQLRNLQSGESREEAVDGILIRIGVEPNTDFLRHTIGLDDEGYVRVNNLAESSEPGIFAAGDVAHPIAPTIGTAVGTGAIAAKAALRYIRRS
jgi:thioredoxin reductase (NADPH)